MRDISSPGPKGTIDSVKKPNTETQMNELYQEVNHMKKLMAQLKKGHAIGEMLKSPAQNEDVLLESIKVQRLDELKK